MEDDKKYNAKMKASVFPFVLSLYIIMGIAAIVIYALDTDLYGVKDKEVSFTPAPYTAASDAAADTPAVADEEENVYDTTGGTAGAARDF